MSPPKNGSVKGREIGPKPFDPCFESAGGKVCSRGPGVLQRSRHLLSLQQTRFGAAFLRCRVRQARWLQWLRPDAQERKRAGASKQGTGGGEYEDREQREVLADKDVQDKQVTKGQRDKRQ